MASLIVFSVAAIYSSLVLVARVWPALFPGQTLSGAIPGLGSVGDSLGIEDGGEGSVFNKRINLLVLGLDKRPYGTIEDRGYLTDSIMVTTVDPITKRSAALSFPRDTLIGIHDEECGERWRDRINTSYSVGFDEGGGVAAGAEQIMRDLSCEFGIEIDHWVVVDYAGVEVLVDAIGGIDVDIPVELEVPEWWYGDEGGRPPDWIEFPAGQQHLNGFEAVAFGRYRNDSDLLRAKRQQLVLQGALSKVLGLGWLDSPGQIRDLWETYTRIVRTDVQLGEAPGYGLLLRQTGGDIATYSIGDRHPIDQSETLIETTLPSGAQVLVYDPENVQYWLNQVFTKAKYADSYVMVQNGREPGEGGERWARATGRYLHAKGLPEVYFGEDVAVQARTEIVLIDPARREMAEDIAEWLNLPFTAIVERAPNPDEPTEPEIEVIIGTDFELPED